MAYGEPFGRGWPSLDTAAANLRRAMRDDAVGYLYRVDAVSYATRSDPYDDDSWTSTPPRLELSAFEVRRWTPCGATLVGMSNYYGTDRWVDLRSSRYWQWASRTPTEAVVHFRNRRRAQLQKLERQFARAREELQLAGETYPRKIALLT